MTTPQPGFDGGTLGEETRCPACKLLSCCCCRMDVGTGGVLGLDGRGGLHICPRCDTSRTGKYVVCEACYAEEFDDEVVCPREEDEVSCQLCGEDNPSVAEYCSHCGQEPQVRENRAGQSLYLLLNLDKRVEPRLIGHPVRTWEALGDVIGAFHRKGGCSPDRDRLLVVELHADGQLEKIISCQEDHTRRGEGADRGVPCVEECLGGRKYETPGHYRLLHVAGCVEPSLVGRIAPTWEALGDEVRKFLKAGEYDEEEDCLFCVELDGKGRLRDVAAFSAEYMGLMRKDAGEI